MSPQSQEVASLHATLKADASQLKRELNQSKSRLKDVRNEIDSQSRPLQKMTSLLGGAAVALGVATTAAFALKKVLDFAREGAELEFVIGKFERLANSIGTSSEALKRDLKIATRGTISDMELLAGATDFMALGLAKSHDEAVRLTKISAALGMNMNQLVLTLTNQTTMRFDALGIAVDGFEKKVKKLERAGMAADLAFKFAFMEQAEAQIDRLGERADTAAGSFDRLDAAWKNFSDEFKKGITPQVTPVLDYLVATNMLQNALHSGAIETEKYNRLWLEVESTLGGLRKGTRPLIEIIEELNKAIAEFEAGKIIPPAIPLIGLRPEEYKAELERARMAGAEAGKLWADEFKAQMSAINLAVSGPLGQERESFLNQQEELLAKAAELRARIREASTFPPNLEQQRELFNLRNELELTNEAVRRNATEHELATKRILFSLLTQRIAQMELSATMQGVAYQMAYDMAAAWGIIDEQTHQALMSIDKGLGLLAQGNIKEAQSEIMRLGQMAASVSGDYYINYIVTTTTRETYNAKMGRRPQRTSSTIRAPMANIPPGGFYPGGFGGGGGGGGTAAEVPEKSLLQKLLETASALSQVGASAADMWRAQIDPLKDQLKAIDELIRPGHIDIYALDRMTEIQQKRAALAEQIANAEEKILRLQEQQQKLRFLESQVRLLELIKENKLNAKDILGGLKLGLGAEAGDIIEATTRALAKLIEKIEKQLKIGSPSRVFMEIGEQMMKGWAVGISYGTRGVKTAMDQALQLSVPGAPGYGYSDGYGGPAEINVNIPIENVTSLIDIETIAYRVAEVMNYRNR